MKNRDGNVSLKKSFFIDNTYCIIINNDIKAIFTLKAVMI